MLWEAVEGGGRVGPCHSLLCVSGLGIRWRKGEGGGGMVGSSFVHIFVILFRKMDPKANPD